MRPLLTRHLLLPLRHHHRLLSTTTTTPQSSFKPTPSPPRLPKADQETFESLTKASTGAFSTPRPSSQTPSQTQTKAESIKEAEDLLKAMEMGQHKDLLTGGEKPLFEGDKNPVTGEVGGPKTEPTKYGDWSFNGRVTDF
ncbi:putative mitochondrial protein, conserved [Orbilia blumenaviensis]|uniref:Succinate dehydrogenase assembly factor 4, mitochondrial n=1 Tax=Orbilia blumenaviensis TaxID=1796055 RepID=A0AAV9VGV6_9PEZI